MGPLSLEERLSDSHKFAELEIRAKFSPLINILVNQFEPNKNERSLPGFHRLAGTHILATKNFTFNERAQAY